MNSLEHSGNGTTEDSLNHSPGRPLEDLESLRQQTEQLYEQLSEADAKLNLVTQQAEEATRLAQREQHEKQGLLQQLWDAISSRDSLRGKLGNMTKQRNQLQRKLSQMTEDRNRLQQELQAIMGNLVSSNQAIAQLETEYDQDLTELANAYRAMNPAQRLSLPPALKNLLDQIEHDYWK